MTETGAIDAATALLPPEACVPTALPSSSVNEIGFLVSDYVAKIEQFVRSTSPVTGTDLITIVLVRAQLAKMAAHWSSDPAQLTRVQTADDELREMALAGDFFPYRKVLASLRITLPGPEHDWWLRLDEVAEDSAKDGAWFWVAMAGVLIAAAIGIGTEVISRFLKNGFDPAGTVALLTQSLLVAVTGASFTESGARSLREIFELTALGRRAYGLSHVLLGACLLTVVLAFKLSLPLWANWYVAKGDRALHANELASAVDSYRRAIALQPDLLVAHYSLSFVDEELGNMEDAGKELRIAGSLPGGTKSQLLAQNNYAEWLLERNRAIDALRPLQQLLRKLDHDNVGLTSKERNTLRYAAYKNLGWAYLEQGNPLIALDNLKRATEVLGNEKRSAPYCLLGMLYEKPDPKLPPLSTGGVNEYWSRCIRYYLPDDPSTRPEWVAHAQRAIREVK